MTNPLLGGPGMFNGMKVIVNDDLPEGTVVMTSENRSGSLFGPYGAVPAMVVHSATLANLSKAHDRQVGEPTPSPVPIKKPRALDLD